MLKGFSAVAYVGLRLRGGGDGHANRAQHAPAAITHVLGTLTNRLKCRCAPRPAPWQAERAAQRVSGVKGLAVEIDVKPQGLSKRTDGDIARSAQNILEWTSWLPKSGPRTAGLPCPVRLNETTSDSPRRTQFARSSVLSVSAMTSQ